jgi:hypothetical protein
MVKLKKLLKAKKVSIAKESEMKKKFRVKPGAITPFGSLHKVGVVLDKTLLETKEALFGAGSFTESLRLKIKDFINAEEPIVGSVGKASGLKVQAPAKQKKKPVRKSAAKRKPKRKTVAKPRPKRKK